MPFARDIFDETHIAGPQVSAGSVAGLHIDLTGDGGRERHKNGIEAGLPQPRVRSTNRIVLFPDLSARSEASTMFATKGRPHVQNRFCRDGGAGPRIGRISEGFKYDGPFLGSRLGFFAVL